MKSSAGSMIGRAAIGSLINPLGAIIGGATAKRKGVDIVDKIEIILTVINYSQPSITIPISMPKHTKKDYKKYEKAIKEAKNIVSLIKVMQYQ